MIAPKYSRNVVRRSSPRARRLGRGHERRTAFIPNFDAAPAVVNLVFISLLVISGGFFPLAGSSVLSQIADVFPLRHLILASFSAFSPGAFPWWHLAVIAACGALAVALRSFRWDARSS
jgi:ABC-2 type transport system permease protein